MSLVSCHIWFVTAMHELGGWNSFLMACCTYKKVLPRFQMRSWLWIFLPGFKLFGFHLSCSLLSILKSMKHRAVCSKICQSWKISIFVCNRLHWRPKDDCIAVIFTINMSIFFLFSFLEIISLVTECIFWQLSNQKYFGFHPNIKTCQKKLTYTPWH